MKNISYLFVTNLGRFILAAIICVVGGVGARFTGKQIFYYIMYTGMALLIVKSLIMITYGLIINPLRNRKK